MQKYRLLREDVARTLPEVRLQESRAATVAELCRVHEADYVAAVIDGTLPASAWREIGFPWSAMMVERSLRSVGATLQATEAAWREGVAINLAGGTHHAAAGKGSGFCVFNDVAVAIGLQRAKGPGRFAVIDLDVHQGNGTADIFQGDADVFTLSMHGERNFPFRKSASTLDIGLPDGCDDASYMAALDLSLQELARDHDRAPFSGLFYLAGADAHEGDRLGHLGLSDEGMQQRDARVLQWAGDRRLPLVICMAGGYGTDLSRMLAVQWRCVRDALAHWQARRRTGTL